MRAWPSLRRAFAAKRDGSTKWIFAQLTDIGYIMSPKEEPLIPVGYVPKRNTTGVMQ